MLVKYYLCDNIKALFEDFALVLRNVQAGPAINDVKLRSYMCWLSPIFRLLSFKLIRVDKHPFEQSLWYVCVTQHHIFSPLYVCVGSKNLATPVHFISSSRLAPRRKKCPRTNEEGPNCQETLPRTILFSVNLDHGRKKQHTTESSLLKRPKGKHKCNESAIGVQQRSNSRISCHLRIKYPQLTSWPHLCGHDP